MADVGRAFVAGEIVQLVGKKLPKSIVSRRVV